jgi:tol-pal system protein YbgF
VAAVSPEAPAGNPKQLYEAAYGYLLQQDYSAAEAGFSDFLKRYPKDSLAPNALYWLGETHYVQRNFADAAEAFDLVTASFGSSGKAPDAQLKRGMALAQLGKKKDACTAFRDVGTKFPSAPAIVKSKAESERQRVGCP